MHVLRHRSEPWYADASALVFSSDNTLVAMATYDYIYLWCVDGEFVVKSQKKWQKDLTSRLAISADNARVIFSAPRGILSEIFVWEIQAGTCEKYVWSCNDDFQCGLLYLRFKPDGMADLSKPTEEEFPITAMQRANATQSDGCDPHFGSETLTKDRRFWVWGAYSDIVVWDLHTNKCKYALRGHQHRGDRIAISPDGTFVAYIEQDDGTLHLWRCGEKECRYVYSSEIGGHFGQIAISSDSTRVAATDVTGRVMVWKPDWSEPDGFNADEAFADMKSAAKTK